MRRKESIKEELDGGKGGEHVASILSSCTYSIRIIYAIVMKITLNPKFHVGLHCEAERSEECMVRKGLLEFGITSSQCPRFYA
jgi:hypothetical protein